MTDYSKAKDARVEKPARPKIITFPSEGHTPVVERVYPEFQCLCPVSSRHDQGVVTLRYLPDKKILESKSVREYLSSWRNCHTWQEFATEEIGKVLYSVCKAKWLVLAIEWSSRGGIYARTESSFGDFGEMG